MRVVAGRDDVAHVHIYVVVGLDLHAALRLVLLELLLALFFELFFVGVAVVVQGANLVDAEERLRVRDVPAAIRVEMDNSSVLQLADSGTYQMVHAPMHRRDREVEQIGIDLVGVVDDWGGGKRDPPLAKRIVGFIPLALSIARMPP